MAVRCSVPIDKRKGRWQVRNYDGGDHDPTRRSNGLPRKAMPTTSSIRPRSGRGCATRSLVLASNREV